MIDAGDIERRLGVFARPVLAATEHGWPTDYYARSERGEVARHMVKMLIDAHICPPYQADGESLKDYEGRRQAGKDTVTAELDAREAAHLAETEGTDDPEILGERFWRFGTRVTHELRQKARDDARQFLVTRGYIEHNADIDPPLDEPFCVVIDDPTVVLDVFRQDVASRIPLITGPKERERILSSSVQALARRLGWR